MFELVYCSKASPDLKSEDISDILKTANDFNAENNITGCLIYYNNEFAQILKGDKDVIMSLYEKIKLDQRHTFVLLLGTGTKATRRFKNWSMAFQDLNTGKDSASAKSELTKNFNAFSELTDNPTLVTDLFFEVSKVVLSKGIVRS